MVAIFFYVGGYLRNNNVSMDVAVPGFFRKYIRVPKIIYLICASPKSNKYPSGIMLTVGLISQLFGIGLAIYGLVFFAYPDALDYLGLFKVVIEIVSLTMILVLSYFIPYLLSKKFPYTE
jgi:hypothetical protein